MEDLIINANVIVPSSISMNGSVRTNSINAGVTIVAVNGEDLPIVDGRVDIFVPTKNSQLENDSEYTTSTIVSEMIGTALTGYQEKLYVENTTLVIPE